MTGEHERTVMPQEKPIDMMMDGVQWVPVEYDAAPPGDGIPYVTHEGVLDLFGVTLKVYTLSDRTRIVDAESMNELFGLADAVAGRTTPLAEVKARMHSTPD